MRSRLERETVILFNDAEPDAIITTSSPRIINLLHKRGYHPLPDWPGHSPKNNERFILPKRRVSLRSRAKTTRTPTRPITKKTSLPETPPTVA